MSERDENLENQEPSKLSNGSVPLEGPEYVQQAPAKILKPVSRRQEKRLSKRRSNQERKASRKVHKAQKQETKKQHKAMQKETRPRRVPRAQREPKIRRITIDVYDGYGNSECLRVAGRLYSDRRLDDVDENDSRLRNLMNTSKRFITNEAEQVWVQVHLLEHILEVQTDQEGRFQVAFTNISDIPFGIHPVTVNLSPDNQIAFEALPGMGQFILHDIDSNRVSIISDVDDTILMTEATSKVRLLKNVFLKNHLTQGAVAGMSDLYRAIHYGPEGDGYDATHYVSSSPVNLYSRINRFLAHQRFPEGSIDLKYLGLRKGSDSLFEHEKYKLGRLQRIFETFPKRRFVLFGDSGEHDPEIYRRLSLLYPEQVVAIYIHNVTGEDPYASRFDGTLLFTSIEKIQRDLIQRKIIYPV